MKYQEGDMIADKYKVIKKIGAGSFGTIYLTKHIQTSKLLAIKVEPVNSAYPLIVYEANVTLLLHDVQESRQNTQLNVDDQTSKGIVKVYSYGLHGNSYFMAMDLLGPSLADLYQFCGYKFSLKTTLMLAYQLIERFEFLNSKKFIHRDIKPDNFLMGLGNKSNIVYVVDMGLAKKY